MEQLKLESFWKFFLWRLNAGLSYFCWVASSTGFFSLEVWIDVDVVLVVDDPDVAAEGHRPETVPAQELDFGGRVAPPPLLF